MLRKYNKCYGNTTNVTAIQQMLRLYNKCYDNTTNVMAIQQIRQYYSLHDSVPLKMFLKLNKVMQLQKIEPKIILIINIGRKILLTK